jgi:TM2 domain-containing membrane protein YozV
MQMRRRCSRVRSDRARRKGWRSRSTVGENPPIAMSWIASTKPQRVHEPNLAALLTWFIPGAGHLYLGRTAFALIAFVIVEGLYFVGLRLSQGMLFEYLEPDLRGLFAGALTPEAANAGALVWQMRHFGYGPAFMRPWPEHMELGVWLTAVSGFLNVCLMVRAHFDARAGDRRVAIASSPATFVFLGWLIPGLGHFAQGRKLRGAIVLLLLCGLLVLGTSLAEGSNLDRERHFYYWAGQFLAGGPVMLLEALFGRRAVAADITYADAGLVFVCLAGLLNVLALMDVYVIAESRLLAAPQDATIRTGAGAVV